MEVMTLIIGGVLGVVNLLGGAMLVSYRERLNNLDKQLQDLPNVYARRDDVRERFQEIMKALSRIEDKVDKKNG